MNQTMFCYQCQETAGCKGCTMSGVCGKKPDVAAMQDLLVYVTKGISAITTALRQEGKQVSAKINHLITLNLFTTITNANFDKESIESRIRATLTEKEVLLRAKSCYRSSGSFISWCEEYPPWPYTSGISQPECCKGLDRELRHCRNWHRGR